MDINHLDAIEQVYIGLKENFHFISGLEILRDYATEAFSIDVIEIAVITVSGCKVFSEKHLQELRNLGWEPWIGDGKNNDNSGAEYRKLNYVDT